MNSKTQYLIDGYNLLFRVAKNKADLKARRMELIEKLNALISFLSLNVTLIFDSADPVSRHPSREHFDTLEIVYTTKGVSADAFILEKLESLKHPEHVTVVTSDRDLSTSCKARKAHTLSIEAFMTLLHKKKNQTKKKARPSRPLRDSDAEIFRLLAIFEKKLKDI